MVANAANVRVAVRPLVVSRNKALTGSIDKAVKTMTDEYFCCTCLWKTVYQNYFPSLVDTLLLSISLHPSLHQKFAFGLQDSIIA